MKFIFSNLSKHSIIKLWEIFFNVFLVSSATSELSTTTTMIQRRENPKSITFNKQNKHSDLPD